MEKIWYNPADPAGFGSVSKLSNRVKETPKKTQKWLSTQLAYSLNKPMRKRFPTRPYKTFGINDVWQMDLMEMIPFAKINKGYKYILTCIDVFSRFARAAGVKTKSASDIHNAMSVLLKEYQPRNIQTDLGKEFYNSKVKSLLNKYGINHYSVHSQYKAALVERFNRTLRERISKYFIHQGNKTWIHVLPKIIHSYNYSPHKGLNKLRPIDISSDSATKFWLSRKQEKIKKPKYKVGDFVRISKISASPFVKNFKQNWSDEVFQITKIDTYQSPVMYVIKDEENNEVQGKFYEQELQVLDKKPDIYRIQKILKTKGVGKHKQYYVKWHGYQTPSWILASQIIQNEK